MALGTLLLWFIGMGVIALAGIVALFILKEGNAYNVIICLLTVCSLGVAYLSANAQPDNFIVQQVVAWVVGAVAVVGLGIHFIAKKPSMLSRVMIAGSVIAGLYYLYF